MVSNEDDSEEDHDEEGSSDDQNYYEASEPDESSKLWYTYKFWSPKFATVLNVIIDIDQTIHLWVTIAKMMYSFWKKGQPGHSYTFWIMPIMIFSLVANFGDQSLVFLTYFV